MSKFAAEPQPELPKAAAAIPDSESKKPQPIDTPDVTLKAAKEKLSDAFKAKRVLMKSSQGQYANQVIPDVLSHPIDELGKQWAKERQVLIDQLNANPNELQTALLKLKNVYAKNLENVVKMAEAYINRIAQEHGGWLDAEAVAVMQLSIHRNASIYSELMIKADKGIQDAFKAALGLTANGKSLSEERKASLPVLAAAAKENIAKGDNSLMPCIWMVVSFLPRADRIEFAKIYATGKPQSEVEEFLRAGNNKGVFGPDEMEEVLKAGNPAYKLEGKATLAENWSRVNNMKAQAEALVKGSYGSVNVAGEMLTIRNGLILLAQVAAGFSLTANLGLGIWKGGALKDLPSLIKAVTHWTVPLNVGIIAGAGEMRKNQPIERSLEGNETREANRHREAIRTLQAQRSGNPLWENFDGFFSSGKNFDGAKVFYDFILAKKQGKKDAELPKEEVTTNEFLAYLRNQKESKKPHRSDVNYQSLLEQFERLAPTSIIAFAESFDTLDIGGVKAGEKYKSVLDELNKA